MKTVALKDVCRITNGGTPKSGVQSFWHGGVAWLTPAEMGKRLTPYIENTARTISQEGLANSSAKLVPPNSVILSTRAPIGHLAINNTPMAFNQGCRGLTPDDTLDVKYLYYFLYFSREALDALGTGTTFKELSSSNLASFQIPLISLDQQRRIVAVLDKTFAGIATATANAQKNLTNARALFESYLGSAFGRDEVVWTSHRLGETALLAIIDGDRGTNYPNKSDFLKTGHCLFLNTKNVRPDGFNFDTTMFVSEQKDDSLRKGKLSRGDVIMTTRGTIGNLAVYDENVAFDHVRINSGMLIFRPNRQKISPRYLFEILRSGIIKKQIAENVSGAAQPQLPIHTLVKFTIPVPDQMTDQNHIVQGLAEIEKGTNKLERLYESKLAALSELKQSLLQRAFAGELT